MYLEFDVRNLEPFLRSVVFRLRGTFVKRKESPKCHIQKLDVRNNTFLSGPIVLLVGKRYLTTEGAILTAVRYDLQGMRNLISL
jgi:hypothetical protein